MQQAKALKAVCDRHGVELRAAALQFPFGHEAVISAVPGAASVAELEDNARVMQVEIPAGSVGGVEGRRAAAGGGHRRPSRV